MSTKTITPEYIRRRRGKSPFYTFADLATIASRHRMSQRKIKSLETCAMVYSGIALPLSQELRMQLVQLAEQNPSALSLCAKDRRVRLVKKLKKENSVSPTLQYFAEYLGDVYGGDNVFKQLMVKVSFERLPKEIPDNSLASERKMYLKVTNPLLFNRITPHVIVAFGDFACNLSSLTVTDDVEEIAEQGYDITKAHYLVMERSLPGKTLADHARKTYDIEGFWRPVLFQIIYTLLCFKDIGLSHNDLHAANILIAEKSLETFKYWMGISTCYDLRTSYLAQIFDFDRSSKIPTKYNACKVFNTRLETNDCAAFGFCNNYYEKRDITRLLYSLFFYPSGNAAAEDKENVALMNWLYDLHICDVKFVASLEKNAEYRDGGYIAHGGVLCTYRGETDPCRPIKPDDHEVKRLKKMLVIIGEPYKNQCHISDAGACDAASVWVLPSLFNEAKLNKCSMRRSLSQSRGRVSL